MDLMTTQASSVYRPWLDLPALCGAPQLIDIGTDLRTLITLPGDSSLSLARIVMDTGRLVCTRYDGTGDTGFYPASTIKWITGFLMLDVMRERGLSVDHVLQVGDDPPRSIRDLLAGMLVMSDNDAFNALQETVGFKQTYDWMLAAGCNNSLIRRHFTRPHWNHSRQVSLWSPAGKAIEPIPARPAFDIPLNSDPKPGSSRQSNWFTTDDLLRCAAVTLMGMDRDDPNFLFVADQLAYTNQCNIREGLWRVTASRHDRPGFVVLNKPGWWPDDGANCELCYIYDVQRDDHYLLAIYVQGTQEEARDAMRSAAQAIFDAILAGRLRLSEKGRA